MVVREENLKLIDGFHRVAAMQELGFQDVDCIVVDCDDETFWDMRIISASTHKAVTFARVIEWIDQVFQLSPLTGKYKNALNLFDTVRQGYGPQESKDWVTTKSQQWGLAPATIRNWLSTAQTLAPELIEEAKASPSAGEGLGLSHYQRVAETAPNQPAIQRQVIEKAKKEDLSAAQTQQVARAMRQAPNEEVDGKSDHVRY